MRSDRPINMLIQQVQKLVHKNICISTSEGILILKIQDIIRVEADRAYCVIHLATDETLVVSKPLRELTGQLPAHHFVRIHASHLVNIDFLKKYITVDGGYVVLSNGLRLPVARRRKQDFLQFLKEQVIMKPTDH